MEKEMTLAQALKLKNKIVSKINKLTGDVTKYNYGVAGKTRPVDVEEAMNQRDLVTYDLVTLKTAINAVNASIQKDIYELAELKGYIALHNTLRNCDSDRYYDRNDEAVEYDMIINISRIDNCIEHAQEEVEAAQDRIDTFNHTTKITVDLKAV